MSEILSSWGNGLSLDVVVARNVHHGPSEVYALLQRIYTSYDGYLHVHEDVQTYKSLCVCTWMPQGS